MDIAKLFFSAQAPISWKRLGVVVAATVLLSEGKITETIWVVVAVTFVVMEGLNRIAQHLAGVQLRRAPVEASPRSSTHASPSAEAAPPSSRTRPPKGDRSTATPTITSPPPPVRVATQRAAPPTASEQPAADYEILDPADIDTAEEVIAVDVRAAQEP